MTVYENKADGAAAICWQGWATSVGLSFSDLWTLLAYPRKPSPPWVSGGWRLTAPGPEGCPGHGKGLLLKPEL